MDICTESKNILTQTYRDKALDTFIRGLKGDLPRLLGIREPVDLPQALHLCLKLENQNYRSHHANGNQAAIRKPSNPPQHLPPRRIFPQTSIRQPFQYHTPQRTQFPNQIHPRTQFSNQAQPTQGNNFHTNYRPNFVPRQTPPAHGVPQLKAEPADNRSGQSRTQFQKGPQFRSQQTRTNNNQRTFHIDTNSDHAAYEQLIDSDNANHDQPLNEYLEAQTQFEQDIDTYNGEISDFTDLNFLD